MVAAKWSARGLIVALLVVLPWLAASWLYSADRADGRLAIQPQLDPGSAGRRQCIITFPNFGHWRCRWYLASKGRMPVSDFLPYTWYNTPNIHFCTFEDFEALCSEREARVINRLAVDQQHRHGWASKLWPNLLGEIGIYRVSSPGLQDHQIAV